MYGLDRSAEQLMTLAMSGVGVALAAAWLRTRGFALHHRMVVLSMAAVGAIVISMLTIPANQLAPRTGLGALAAIVALLAVVAELLLRRPDGA
jgi:hypothetical protein